MEKKIKLVVCEKSNELFVAPGESVIEEGDLIEIENSNVYMNVKSVCTLWLDRQLDIIEFMVALSGKPLPLRKVKKIIEERVLDYDFTDDECIKMIIALKEKENNNERINPED